MCPGDVVTARNVLLPVLDWRANLLGLPDVPAVCNSRTAPPLGERRATDAPCLPPAGERSPIRGSLLGFNLAHSRADIAGGAVLSAAQTSATEAACQQLISKAGRPGATYHSGPEEAFRLHGAYDRFTLHRRP